MDIGSGQHKLLVAAVDRVSGTIVQKLHAEQQQVLLNHDLVQNAAASSGPGLLSDAVLARSHEVLTGFHERALAAGATEFCGIATAVFRRAGNGDAYLERVNNELGLHLRIISQQLEGRLGYLAAASGTPPTSAPLVAWDSGGGSFQISAQVDGTLQVWEGPVGDSNVCAALLGVQGKAFVGSAHGSRSTPNPVSVDEARALVGRLEEELLPASPPAWLPPLLATPDAQVVGFGERTSIFALASALCGTEAVTQEAVWAAVERASGKGDAELCEAFGPLHDEEDLVMPKLLLLHTLMRRLGIRQLREVRTMGNAEGVLLCEQLWARGASAAPS